MRGPILYYGGLLGVLYVLYGFLQVYNGLVSLGLQGGVLQIGVEVYGVDVPNAFPDVFSGVALTTTGLLFLKSAYLSLKGSRRYRGYLFAAWLLSMLLMLLNIVELFAGFVGAYYPLLLGSEPEGWSLAADPWGIAPHLVLGALASPLYLVFRDFIKELTF